MKKLQSILLIVVVCFIMLSIQHCKKNDESDVTPTPTPAPTPPAVLNMPVVESISPASTDAIDVFSSIVVKFKQANKVVVQLNTVNYRSVVDTVLIKNYASDTLWSSDKTQVTIRHIDAFTPKSKITIRVVSHWEELKNNVWQTVNWNNVVVSETKVVDYTAADKTNIELNNIQYAYPIPNQYHFLPKEYPQGFLKLVNGQDYLFTDSDYESWVEFQTPSQTIIKSLTYVKDENKLTYDIPASLGHETIYKLVFKRKNKSSGVETELCRYAFRTSKFDRFLEKLATTQDTGKGGIWFVSAGVATLNRLYTPTEGYDEFELESKLKGKKNENYDNIDNESYASGLIRFSIVWSGNEFYDSVNKLFYAPWDDGFVPKYRQRDTTQVGRIPKRAMFATATKTGKLTNDQITANVAPPLINSETYYLEFKNNMVLFLAYDYNDFKSQVADLPASTKSKTRQTDFLNSKFTYLLEGDYPFNVLYTLPDGTVTTIYRLSLSFHYRTN